MKFILKGENVKPDKLVFGRPILGRIEGYKPASFRDNPGEGGPAYPRVELK
jgi:hypothetical protein